MDNKLTKKRLSDFLSYDWIIMLVVIVAAIVLWELVYTIAAVRLTEGQNFKYYYDVNMYAGNDAAFYSLITEDEDDPLVFVEYMGDFRINTNEVDVVFTQESAGVFTSEQGICAAALKAMSLYNGGGFDPGTITLTKK